MGSTKSGPAQSPSRRRQRFASARTRLTAQLRGFAGSTSGTTAIEYSVLLTMVAATLIGLFIFAGGSINTMFNELGNAIPDAQANAPGGAEPAAGEGGPV